MKYSDFNELLCGSASPQNATCGFCERDGHEVGTACS